MSHGLFLSRPRSGACTVRRPSGSAHRCSVRRWLFAPSPPARKGAGSGGGSLGKYNIAYHLDRSRLCRLAESPDRMAFAACKAPKACGGCGDRAAARLRARLLRRVVGGQDRAERLDRHGRRNAATCAVSRLWGAGLSCCPMRGYPEGMDDGETMVTYGSPDDAVEQIRTLLGTPQPRLTIARAGHEMVSTRYSKEAQWKRFEALVASISRRSMSDNFIPISRPFIGELEEKFVLDALIPGGCRRSENISTSSRPSSRAIAALNMRSPSATARPGFISHLRRSGLDPATR